MKKMIKKWIPTHLQAFRTSVRRKMRRTSLLSLGWHPLHRVSVRMGLGVAFYRWSVRLLSWVVGFQWIQRLFFAKQLALLEQFIDLVDLSSVPHLQTVAQRYLMYECLRRGSYEEALRRFEKSDLERLITFEGWNHLQNAIASKNGVLLVTGHSGLIRAMLVCLPKFGVDFVRVGGRHVRNQFGARKQSPLERTQQTFAAFTALEAGGAVFILPDGNKGKTTLTLPFLGRMRRWQMGFMELAAMTHAEIIAFWVDGTETGHLNVKFEPLTLPANMPIAQAKRQLLEQYRNRLEKIWLDDPAAIDSRHLHRYIDRKKAFEL